MIRNEFLLKSDSNGRVKSTYNKLFQTQDQDSSRMNKFNFENQNTKFSKKSSINDTTNSFNLPIYKQYYKLDELGNRANLMESFGLRINENRNLQKLENLVLDNTKNGGTATRTQESNNLSKLTDYRSKYKAGIKSIRDKVRTQHNIQTKKSIFLNEVGNGRCEEQIRHSRQQRITSNNKIQNELGTLFEMQAWRNNNQGLFDSEEINFYI